jgi:hypothetical protein
MASVRFPCGHINYPTFDRGSRFMPCQECLQWTAVVAHPHQVIEYEAYTTNYVPPETTSEPQTRDDL